MKLWISSLALAATLSISPAIAQENEGKHLTELAFSSNANERGFIDMGEFSNFGEDMFVSMDSDDSGKLTLDEFMAWGFGFANVAEERDRVDAYEAAQRILFAFRDRNGDGEISRTENRQTDNLDFQRADLNGDAVLTKDEFLHGYTVMIAFRAALDPNL